MVLTSLGSTDAFKSCAYNVSEPEHICVGPVAAEDVDVGSGPRDVDVMSGSGSICVELDESHIEGSEDKGRYVLCFEHEVEICGDRERAKANVCGSDPSSTRLR